MFTRNENKNSETEMRATCKYKYSIETKTGVFTGTCLSIDELNKEIALLTNNARILKKNIIPIALKYEDEEDKIYTWNVITKNVNASGISASLKGAQRALNSFRTKQVIKSTIIESFEAIK